MLVSFEEIKNIIIEAFNRLAIIYKLHLTYNGQAWCNKDHDSIFLHYTYHGPESDSVRTCTLDTFWFDVDLWDKAYWRDAEYNTYKNLVWQVERLVPESLNKDPKTMMILRIAARFYILAKWDGLIK